MRSVFVVQHAYELEDCEEVKMIGVYSSKTRAREAVARLVEQPGFRDVPNGFSIDEYPLDRDHWTEGFFTATLDG